MEFPEDITIFIFNKKYMEPSMSESCAICSVFTDKGWETENTPDSPSKDRFPENFGQLNLYKDFNSFDFRRILLCPECGSYFLYTRTTPGGSYDAMKTYIVERLIPITAAEVHELIQKKENSIQEIRETSDKRCTHCKRFSVETISAGTIGGEYFCTLKCAQCGFEDTVDETQLEDWYR